MVMVHCCHGDGCQGDCVMCIAVRVIFIVVILMAYTLTNVDHQQEICVVFYLTNHILNCLLADRSPSSTVELLIVVLL